jgi:hypothetical protein
MAKNRASFICHAYLSEHNGNGVSAVEENDLFCSTNVCPFANIKCLFNFHSFGGIRVLLKKS